jgi:hypothetical protein
VKLEPKSPHDGFGMTHEAYEAWIASRPPIIQKLSTEFPMGSVVPLTDGDYYVIGWGESDTISLSKIWLGDDYDRAIAGRVKIHAHHLRDGEVVVRRFLAS